VLDVPRGVRFATFDVYGAAGGGAGLVAGGDGAQVRATIPLPASGTLTIVVGGRGGDATGITEAFGGFNGAAPGARAARISCCPARRFPAASAAPAAAERRTYAQARSIPGGWARA
jgi:hypothetical protein